MKKKELESMLQKVSPRNRQYVLGILSNWNTVVSEAFKGNSHYWEMHVGKTTTQMLRRLSEELKIPATSTFDSLKEAKAYTSETLLQNIAILSNWVEYSIPGERCNFFWSFPEVIGCGVFRKDCDEFYGTHKCKVVLERVDSACEFVLITTMPYMEWDTKVELW